MSTFPLRSAVVALCLALPSAAFAQLAPEDGPQRTATQPTTRSQAPDIAVDQAARAVTLDTIVWQNRVGLEVFACGPMGREHETVLIVFNNAGQLYEALRQIGGLLPASMPTDDQATLDLRGPRLLATVTWTGADGKPVTRLGEELLLDDLTLTPAAPVGWSFLARDNGPTLTGAWKDSFEINLTYVGLRGEAEGLLEYAIARQPYAPTSYTCNTGVLPPEIPRPEGVPAKLRLVVTTEAEALRQILADLEQRHGGRADGAGLLPVARGLLPLAEQIDRDKAAFFGPANEAVTSAAKAVSALAEKNVDPKSPAAQKAVAELEARTAARAFLRARIAQAYALVDLAYAQHALTRIPADVENRMARVGAQLAAIRQIKNRADAAALRGQAARWQVAAAMARGAAAPASQPGDGAVLVPPSAVPAEFAALWCDLQARKLLALADLVPAQETLAADDERLARDKAYFEKLTPTDGLYNTAREMHQRVVEQHDQSRLTVEVLTTQSAALAAQQQVLEASGADERQWRERRWKETTDALGELGDRLALATAVNERANAAFELEKLQIVDSPENKARSNTLRDRIERLDVRIAELRARLGVPASAPAAGN